MTVMYPLTVQIDYTELRYSLRSVEKFLPGHEVMIVGDYLPDWITGVTQIWMPDVKGQNQYSVRRKILAALEYEKEFLFMNDDFYLLQKDFPYYSSGNLKNKGESGARPVFKQLEAMNKPTKYYGHYPAVYRRDFKEVIKNFPNECITKSAYLNFIEVESVEVPDCKILQKKKVAEIKEFIKDKPCFSTGIYSLESCVPVLEELFPNPSRFEI